MKGRVQLETAFFGLLAAVGLAALLVAMLLGALFAVGAASASGTAADQVDRVAAGGGAIAMAILALAGLTGGYVAGRMARFAGWKQGLAVWLLAALVAAVVVLTAWIAGGDLDPVKSIDVPSDPVDAGPLSNGPLLVAVAGLIALATSVLGGVLGERFHRALDREALDEPEPQAEAKSEPEPERETVGTPA
jgi:hypothetical protein